MSEAQYGEFSRFYERYGDPTPELHQAYDSWLEDMSAREGSALAPYEFDLDKHPEQDIWRPVTEAKPEYALVPDFYYYRKFNQALSRSIGQTCVSRLIEEFSQRPASSDDPTPLGERLKKDRRDDKNLMVVTSHFSFNELGYVRALRHLTQRDRKDIDHNGVLMNKIMSRQSYKDKTLVDHFRPLGNIHWSYPKSKSAEKHEVPKNAMILGNALFVKTLRPLLTKGGYTMDVALTGSEVKKAVKENGEFSHYYLPDVDPASANLVKDFHNILPVTMINDSVDGQWKMQIGDLLDVEELVKSEYSAEQITDMVYANIVPAIEKFTRKEVTYRKLYKPIGRAAFNGV